MCNHAGLRLQCALQTQTEFNSIRTLLLFHISFRTRRFITNFLGEKISSGRSLVHYILYCGMVYIILVYIIGGLITDLRKKYKYNNYKSARIGEMQ